jgi:hypothetical protein
VLSIPEVQRSAGARQVLEMTLRHRLLIRRSAMWLKGIE